ncbi:MAG: hypothetical protein V4520_05190 [Bacteroidota bacterium]
MKKYINIVLAALVTLTMFSCTKKADVDAIEPKLPSIKLSSLGYQQSGPFVISGSSANTLLINFGATLTSQETGAFKLEILEGSTVVSTVNFASWNGYDATSITNPVPPASKVLVHSISAVPQETTYKNTTVLAGTILLKLSSLGLTAGKTYGARATAYNKDASLNSVFTQSSFFVTK